MDIKDECERLLMLCQGCLSADRKLACITGQNKALFTKLREDDKQNENNTSYLLLCWECIALLNKMKHFQARIKTAQHRLVQYLQNLYNEDDSVWGNTLSLLIKTKHKEYDYKYQFIYEEEQEDLIFDQNNLILEQKDHIFDQNNHKLEQKDLIFSQKEETDSENVLLDVKIENDIIIKEEYDNISINNDIDYYETECKQETDEDHIFFGKQKKRDYKYQSIKKYEKYATVTQNNTSFTKVSQYYDTVFISVWEMEQFWKSRVRQSYKKLPFRCTLCKLGYYVRLDILRHKTFHHAKLQFPTTCTACKREVLSQSHLEEHWKDYHNPMLRCTLCGDLSRGKAELKKHLNRSHTQTYTCNSCPLEFRNLGEFRKHYVVAHERVVCDYCNISFISKRKLEMHIRKKHLPYHCSICNRSYRVYHTYENHLKTVHPEILPSSKIANANKEIRYCVECDKQYSSINKYQQHLRQSARHRPKKKIRIPCPSCDKIFTRTNYKNNHYRLVHMKQSKHYCELCNKYFANGYGLRKHIQRVHQKIALPKDKICDLCGRGFSTNRILIHHRRTHTGERPFKCQYCPATFAQETAMKTHQKSQHKNIVLSC